METPRLTYADLINMEIDMQSRLDAAREHYLQESGWVAVFGEHFGFWTWSKEINGKEITCMLSFAVQMQAALDERERGSTFPSLVTN